MTFHLSKCMAATRDAVGVPDIPPTGHPHQTVRLSLMSLMIGIDESSNFALNERVWHGMRRHDWWQSNNY